MQTKSFTYSITSDLAKSVFFLGETIEKRSTEQKIGFNQDHLGNTRIVYEAEWDADLNQVKFNLKGAYDYFPYGKILRSYVPGDGYERYLTTGHERDHESISENNAGTGLDNRGARFYDSDVARFLSLDPHATDYPSWSDYNYVLGNPVMFIDPDGKNAWKPEVGDDGTTSYTAEAGDSKETFASQYGLSSEQAGKIIGNQDVVAGKTKISGQSVFNETGSEALRLDLMSPQATSQRIFDQFLFARDLSASKGLGSFQSSEFYSNRLKGSTTGMGGTGSIVGRANMTVNGKQFGVMFNLPLYRMQFDGSSNSVSLGVNPVSNKSTSGRAFENQANVRFPMYHPNTGAVSQGYDIYMNGSNMSSFYSRFNRLPQRNDYYKTNFNFKLD